jgi:hypothetical protein
VREHRDPGGERGRELMIADCGLMIAGAPD